MSLFETIQYRVLKKEGNCEIRIYDNILLASTKTAMNRSMDSGFNNVFNYISGNNQKQEKISMTTPVVSYEEDNSLVTGFYVPSKFTKETVLKPSEQSVYIQELKESLYAVIKFRGSWTEKNYTHHDDILKDYISKSDYEITSPRLILRYQPPFIPGIFRHNEIAYQVKTKS